MKKVLYSITAALVLFGATANASEYKVFVNDTEMNGLNVFIDENNRTQLPVRMVSETLGCDVSWDPVDYEVTVTDDDTVIKLIIGEPVLYKNDETIYMDTSARLVNDMTYIPIRYIAEALGCTIQYEQEDKAIYIVNGSQGYIEVMGAEDPSVNTNPRGLFPMDFSTIDPTPLSDEWYTKDTIPDNIMSALNKTAGYEGRTITKTNDEAARNGSYELSNGPYKQDFAFDKEYSYSFCTETELKSSTGRIAVMLGSEAISSDDLWVGITLHEMRKSENGNQPFFKEAWHKPFDDSVVVVFDELDKELYYSIMISDVSDPENSSETYTGTITIAEF